METYALHQDGIARELVKMAHQSCEPIVVMDGEDECLIAMTPSIFERILFDTNLLNQVPREELHI